MYEQVVGSVCSVVEICAWSAACNFRRYARYFVRKISANSQLAAVTWQKIGVGVKSLIIEVQAIGSKALFEHSVQTWKVGG